MERRKFIRLNQTLTVTYKIVDAPCTHTELTKDISQQGLCIKTHTIIDNNTMVEIRLKLQDGVGPVKFLGIVMWSQPVSVFEIASEQPFAETGIRIVSIDEKDRKHLMKLIQSNSLTQ